MPNTNSAPKKKRTFKVKEKKEKLYKVTLKFSFTPSYDSTEDFEKGERGYDDETNEEFCARIQEWKDTDKEYGTDAKIQAHVKRISAMEFIEYLPPGEVLSAQWLSGFGLTFIMKPESPEYESVEAIKDWIESFSLEDGEYESSGDNGWTVKTLRGTMEYGLTDYRDHPIEVVETSSRVLSGGRRRQTRRRR